MYISGVIELLVWRTGGDHTGFNSVFMSHVCGPKLSTKQNSGAGL